MRKRRNVESTVITMPIFTWNAFFYKLHCNFSCEGHHFCVWNMVIFRNHLCGAFCARGLVRLFFFLFSLCTRLHMLSKTWVGVGWVGWGGGDVMMFLARAHMWDATQHCFCFSLCTRLHMLSKTWVGVGWVGWGGGDVMTFLARAHKMLRQHVVGHCPVWSCLTLTTNKFASSIKCLWTWHCISLNKHVACGNNINYLINAESPCSQCNFTTAHILLSTNPKTTKNGCGCKQITNVEVN